MPLLTRLDFFPKTYDELSERTLSGAVISIACTFFIVWAAAHELQQCMAVETHDRLLPQMSAEHGGVLSINLDLVFPSLPCSEVTLELTDSSGKEQLHFSHDPDNTLTKLRMSTDGSALGMPAKMDFVEKVALGLRLHRFMDVFGDVLSKLLCEPPRSSPICPRVCHRSSPICHRCSPV